jgi:hypothetical protein
MIHQNFNLPLAQPSLDESLYPSAVLSASALIAIENDRARLAPESH